MQSYLIIDWHCLASTGIASVVIFDPVLGVFSSMSINFMASTDIDSHWLTLTTDID